MNFLLGMSGRIGRAKWWLGQFINLSILLVAIVFFVVSSGGGIQAEDLTSEALATHPGFLFLFALLFWINACLTVKRYHDLDKSGWWFLICFVPYVGQLWQLVECGFFRGTDGVNSYDGGNSSRTYSSDGSYGPSGSVDDQIAAMVRKNNQGAEPSYAEQQPVGNSRTNQTPSFGKAASPVFGKR